MSVASFSCFTPLSFISFLARLCVFFTSPLTARISRQFCSSRWMWVVELMTVLCSCWISVRVSSRPLVSWS